MRRAILGALALALIPATLSACKDDKPAQTATAAPENQLASDADGVAVGGPPNQEIASDFYKTLTRVATDYPQLRAEIIRDFKGDGYITYAEYDQIIRDQQKLTDDEGQKEWDGYIMSYRNALKKAAKS